MRAAGDVLLDRLGQIEQTQPVVDVLRLTC